MLPAYFFGRDQSMPIELQDSWRGNNARTAPHIYIYIYIIFISAPIFSLLPNKKVIFQEKKHFSSATIFSSQPNKTQKLQNKTKIQQSIPYSSTIIHEIEQEHQKSNLEYYQIKSRK
jgi:hypothetical protein